MSGETLSEGLIGELLNDTKAISESSEMKVREVYEDYRTIRDLREALSSLGAKSEADVLALLSDPARLNEAALDPRVAEVAAPAQAPRRASPRGPPSRRRKLAGSAPPPAFGTIPG